MFLLKSKKTKPDPTENNSIPEKQLPELKWENHLQSVMAKTGLSREDAKSCMTAAKKQFGISYKDYDKFDFYKTPDEEKAARYKRILKRREAREQCITMIMDHKECDRKEAIAVLNECRERLDVSYRIYRRYHFFELKPDEQAERLMEINRTQEDRRLETEEKEAKFGDLIIKETGWDRQRLTEELERSNRISGANMTDFYAFRLWELSPEEQSEYFTRDLSKSIADRLDTNAIYTDTLLNKELSCVFFSDFMRRPWAINRKCSFEDFKSKFERVDKLVYKPLDGHGGIGIRFFGTKDRNLKDIYDEIYDLPRGIVESFVKQHSEMNRLAPNSVNTVRIVTVSSNANGKDITNDFCDIAYAAVRIGRGDSKLDNFSKGGFVAGVDKNTGVVVTNGVSVDGEVFDIHPDTGIRLKGFKIPMFNEVLEFVTEMAGMLTGYIGWDIAISETGPMLIEANTNPGNRLLQMPYAPDRIGMKHVMQKYLNDIIE